MANFKAQAIAEETAKYFKGTVSNYKDLFFVVFTDNKKRPSCQLFKANSTKCKKAYFFKNEDQRKNWITDTQKKLDEEEEKKEKEEEKNKTERENTLKSTRKGDILCHICRCNYTRVSFFQVIEKKSKTRFILRELKQLANDNLTGYCRPIKDLFKEDKAFVSKIDKYGRFILEDKSTATFWDGTDQYFNLVD